MRRVFYALASLAAVAVGAAALTRLGYGAAFVVTWALVVLAVAIVAFWPALVAAAVGLVLLKIALRRSRVR